MATDTTLAKIQEEQNIIGQQIQAQSAIIRGGTATESQINAAIAERDKLRKELAVLREAAQVASGQTPANSLYEGVDSTSGQYRYYNSATGTSYLSATPPTDTQQSNVREPATGYIDTSTQNLATTPAVATSQVPVAVQPMVTSVTNEDPFEAARLEREQEFNSDFGGSAVDSPALLTDEDPFEAARLEREQELNRADLAEGEGLADPEPISDEDPFEAARLEREQELNRADLASEEETAGIDSGSSSAVGARNDARSKATQRDQVSFEKAADWRVRLSLAPGAKYLYAAGDPGILAPLKETKGVIFPYTPAINISYVASYDAPELIHSNYKIYQYKNSAVDTVQIVGDFTAQDNKEANYLLAVIHFFRSVTKMFYGQDNNPKNGTPPPLCYLSGLGTYQFDNHPLVISNFSYNLPTDVDYIRATSTTNMAGQNTGNQGSTQNTVSASGARMSASGLMPKVPNFQRQDALINSEATYVPTRIQLTITALPVVSRNDISNRFSLADYATGKLLRGSQNNAGGIW